VARVLDVGQHAVGVVAIGQHATGVIAIGQIATGVVAIGQVSRGVIAVGMVAFGLWSFGMAALGVGWSSGLVAVGGRVGAGLVKIPLVPRLPSALTAKWSVLAGAQLSGLVIATVAFWVVVGVPVGDSVVEVVRAYVSTPG
jgi:hypothetical protein